MAIRVFHRKDMHFFCNIEKTLLAMQSPLIKMAVTSLLIPS